MANETPRRAVPCHACRKRRLACNVSSNSRSCDRCSKLSLPCNGFAGSSPRANEVADLRVELKRLSDVVRHLESDATDTAQSDIVCRLTRMCISQGSLDGPATHRIDLHNNDEELQQMARELVVRDDHFENSGFVLDASLGKNVHTFDDLITELPSWTGFNAALLAYSQSWHAHVEALYTPAYPTGVQRMYELQFRPKPSADVLADLFAVLALHSAIQAVVREPFSSEARGHQKTAFRYYVLCKRALELANHTEEPSLLSMRALYSCAAIDCCLWVDTSRFRLAIANFPLLISLALRMGWDRDQQGSDDESAVERYERRALTNAIVRLIWWFGGAQGGSSIAPSRAWDVVPPSPLDETQVPLNAPYEALRASAKQLKGISAMTAVAALLNALESEMVSTPSHDRIQAIAAKLRALRNAILQGEWRVAEDAVSGELQFAVPTASLPCCMQVLRAYCALWLSSLGVYLHDHFLLGSNEDITAWHRSELVQHLRLSSLAMAECMVTAGDGFSTKYHFYNLLVASGLLLSSFSTLPPTREEAQFCDTLIRGYLNLQLSKKLDRPTERLIHLLGLLFERTARSDDGKRRRLSQAKAVKLSMPEITAGGDTTSTAPDTPFHFESSLTTSMEEHDQETGEPRFRREPPRQTS